MALELEGHRIRPVPSFAALCLTYISLNPGADALPDPQQDSQGPDSITPKAPAWEDFSHSESETPKSQEKAGMPSGVVGPASLKHVIHDQPCAGSRRGKWNMVNSYGSGEGSGT